MITMIDATHASASNIPATAPKVAGYVTGTKDIAWTPTDWLRFPHSGRVRIDQGYTWPPDPHSYDVIDVENLAVTVAEVPAAVHNRIVNGIQWTTVYASDAPLAAVEAALIAAAAQYGHGWYWGHVDCWLADWDLSEQEAVAKLGTLVHGLTCRAVQWASPRWNPGTLVPGSTLTLRQANVDLSVTQNTWFQLRVPPPPAWTAQALELAGQAETALAQLTALLKAHQ